MTQKTNDASGIQPVAVQTESEKGIILKELFRVHSDSRDFLICTLPGTPLALFYTRSVPSDYNNLRIECQVLKTGQVLSSFDIKAVNDDGNSCYCALAGSVWEGQEKGGYLVPLYLSSWNYTEVVLLHLAVMQLQCAIKLQLHIHDWQEPQEPQDRSQRYNPVLQPYLNSEFLIQPVSSTEKRLCLLVFAHHSPFRKTIITDIRFNSHQTDPGVAFITSCGELVFIVAVPQGYKRIRVPSSIFDDLVTDEDYHCNAEFISRLRDDTPPLGVVLWTGFMTTCQSSDKNLVTRFAGNPPEVDCIGLDDGAVVKTFTLPESIGITQRSLYRRTQLSKGSSPKQTAHILHDFPSLQLVWWDLEAEIPTLRYRQLHVPTTFSSSQQPNLFLVDDARGEVLMRRYDDVSGCSDMWCYSFI